jgi:hypothetical protein
MVISNKSAEAILNLKLFREALMAMQGIPKGAAIAIADLLDNCARVQPGQEVLILAQVDGLYGGDNMVDQESISWIQSAVQYRGANPSVLWIDEPAKIHAWRFPPIVKGAMSACDLMINNSFDMTFEEIIEFKRFTWDFKKLMVYNIATTAPLLNTAWAQTPYELVSEIRYQAAVPIKEGLSWILTDPNGTHLEGKIVSAFHPTHPWFTSYSVRREESGYYRPWPEWVHPPIRLSDTSGVFIFDCMLSWWSRYIGIPPYFTKPIILNVEKGRMVKIEGGTEAEALKQFLKTMSGQLGESMYDFNALHFGVHPQAKVSESQCPNILHRRRIEHSHTSNMHVHIGVPETWTSYPYMVHITGDIRTPTFKVGDTVIHDKGYLTALDHPAVKAIAAKYPGRPGLDPEPVSF